ncbi:MULTISPECIES: hypothetical protein [unclassified Streptomyces]|uniref:hypothetical protein n=1 Tax=Streptomyces sp. NPDC055082 TaxID=3365718 RepID=UPI0037D21188
MRTIPPAILAVSAGVFVGAAGLLPTPRTNLLLPVGILGTLAALPAVTCWAQRRAHLTTADQLADAHTAGYRMALDHVARGLLEPTPTGDGHRATPENVRWLHTRSITGLHDERKAL